MDDDFLQHLMAALGGHVRIYTDPIAMVADMKQPITEGFMDAMEPVSTAMANDPRIELSLRASYPDPRAMVN